MRFSVQAPKATTVTLWLWDNARIKSAYMVEVNSTFSNTVVKYKIRIISGWVDDGKWEYVNTNRPYKKDSIQTKIYADGLPKEMREYMIYLPLYDGVNWMEIGVDSTATIQQPILNNPRKEKKIV